MRKTSIVSSGLALLTMLGSFILSVAPAQASDELLGAAVALDLQPKVGIPLAGYGSKLRRLKPFDWKNEFPHSFFFKPSEGVHTPIRSKVLFLKKRNRNLVFISLDTIGVEKRFVKDLVRELKSHGIREAELIVSGTHTHSGPGTLSRTLPLELVATDLFIGKNYRHILNGVRASVLAAKDALEPVELFKTSFQAEGIQKNKFRYEDQEHYDKNANFLLARSKATRHWLGGLLNFAIHGGGMPIELPLYSSDFPGQLEIQIESKLSAMNPAGAPRPAVLFMNGAEGDVATPDRGIAHIEDLGKEFARQADAAFSADRLAPVRPDFEVERRRIWLGVPGSPLKYCVGGLFAKSPVPLRVPLLGFVGQFSYITRVSVGDITMMTWPGEPSTSLGLALKAQARKRGHADPWVLGLTNDYMTYFTTKQEYFEGAYDSCSSLFNWRGGKRILSAYDKMLKRSR